MFLPQQPVTILGDCAEMVTNDEHVNASNGEWYDGFIMNRTSVRKTMMEPARDAIAQTLAEVKSFLAQESPPRLSEADTKAYFIEPLIRALGWEGIGVVTREYYVRNSQEFIDYLLKGQAGPLIAIEAKTIQAELVDKHAAQLVQYCAVEGIEWAVLTNGRELHLFNTFLKRDLAAKRVMRLDLLAFNSDDEFNSVFTQLWKLSREEMTTPSGVRSWMHQRRMDSKLRELLVNPRSSVIRHLEEVLSDAEIQATSQDLTQWFNAVLAAGPTLVMIPPRRTVAKDVGSTTMPGQQIARYKAQVNKASSDGGRLLPLIEAGVLEANTRLVLRKGQSAIAEAHVDERGCIIYQGQQYPSPSHKTFVHLLDRKSMNGWTHWFADEGGKLILLDELRKRMVSGQGKTLPA